MGRPCQCRSSQHEPEVRPNIVRQEVCGLHGNPSCAWNGVNVASVDSVHALCADRYLAPAVRTDPDTISWAIRLDEKTELAKFLVRRPLNRAEVLNPGIVSGLRRTV